MVETVLRIIQSYTLPRILGGGTREYAQVTMMEASRGDLEELRKLVNAGDLKGVVDSVWEMEDALKVIGTKNLLPFEMPTSSQQAYDRWQNHSIRGKVVIKVSSPIDPTGDER